MANLIRWFRPLTVFVLLGGCGAEGPGNRPEQVGTSSEFVVWNPGSALVNEHTAWHSGACGPTNRKCPRSGADFLTFHRNYLDRLRDEFHRQGRTENITTWTSLPAAMKATTRWRANQASLQAAENALNSMIDPATGQRFASLERFGTYLENNYHNDLHGIAQEAFGESAIGPVNMSPTSTYFFKIHGLVEWYYQRFERGDFNKDGKSDLFVRNVGTGGNQIWLMNGTSVSSRLNAPGASLDSCNWYVGATADLNYDGHQDLVWHTGPCSRSLVWFMNRETFVGQAEMLAVNNDWRLIGSADFTGDVRPDLVWRHISGDIHVWRMNGAVHESSIGIDVPTGFWPVLVVHDSANPALIYQRSGSTPENLYFMQMLDLNAVPLLRLQISGLTTSIFATPSASGRYQAQAGASDVVFFDQPPAPSASYRFGLKVPSEDQPFAYGMTSSVAMNINERIQGPR